MNDLQATGPAPRGAVAARSRIGGGCSVAGRQDGNFGLARRRRSRGLVLIVVLVCMTLAGSLVVLISGSLAGYATTVRQERIEMTMRQLIDSGRVWAEARPRRDLDAGTITLDAGPLALPDSQATVEIGVAGSGAARELRITAILTRDGDAPLRRTSRFRLEG